MELWLDTTNIDAIKEAHRQGVLFGVTTNPSIIAKSGKPLEKVLKEILKAQPGPVTAQVIAEDTEGMIRQAKKLHKFSKRLIVKIPVTSNGLAAISELARKGIPTMATVVFSPNQVLLAATAGALYIAPYLGRIKKSGEDPFLTLDAMLKIIDAYKFESRILAASIKSTDEVTYCATLGTPAITMNEEVFEQLIEHKWTDKGIKQFEKDWKKAKPTKLIN